MPVDKENELVPIEKEQEQWLMIHMYMEGKSLRQIGRELNTSHMRVSRYLQTPEAQTAVNKYRKTMADFLCAQVEAANLVALRTAAAVASDPDEDNMVKLKAAEIIASHYSRLTKTGRSATIEARSGGVTQQASRGPVLDVIFSDDPNEA